MSKRMFHKAETSPKPTSPSNNYMTKEDVMLQGTAACRSTVSVSRGSSGIVYHRQAQCCTE